MTEDEQILKECQQSLYKLCLIGIGKFLAYFILSGFLWYVIFDLYGIIRNY